MIPVKVLPSREGHVVVKDKETVLPECSRPTLPGLISERSCAFYGARWMLASIPDAVHLVHGPAGCAYYGRTVRRKTYRIYSTRLAESDVVFGASEKLYKSILDAFERSPEARAVLVYGTCVAGITAEDLPAVCKRAAGSTGRPVVPVNCPGFCGRSQAAGHDIAAEVLMEHFIGRGQIRESVENSVNILGEFDVQGDLNEIESLLQRLNLTIVCAFSGRASIKTMADAHRAKLNVVHCRRTGLHLAERMRDRFCVPYIKASFFGFAETAYALRSIAQRFQVPGVEAVIENGFREIESATARLLPKLAGKRVALFFGASRIGSMAKAFAELGMEVVLAGTQFGCREDYREAGEKVADGTVLIDDANEKELEEFIAARRPDLLVGGTKEKYLAHKLGIPFLVFPQESGPFAGFNGFINLARQVAGLVGAPVWRMARRKSKDRQP